MISLSPSEKETHDRCRVPAVWRPLTETFVDLGMSPLCESYLRADQLDQRESFYPLHVRMCSCLLVQLPAYVPGEEIFSDYAYFSSYSDSWVAHAKRYADAMVTRLGLGPQSLVTEVASNDGYLLQHFVAAGVPVLGVEPAANIAEVARDKGIRTEVRFWGADRRRTGGKIWPGGPGRRQQRLRSRARSGGLHRRSGGTGQAGRSGDAGVSPPAAADRRRQYDTIYHEHYQYLSLLTAQRALATGGLWWSTWSSCPPTAARCGCTRGRRRRRGGRPAVKEVLELEAAAGLHTLAGHRGFAEAVHTIKHDLL